ncbi:putative mitochondrial protein AtMg01250 [Silene latifolia]|uniref:putative mitochondrial protein AtMg01250 n=1 Tax=Silene latifolia TaxID=37657 RepID=UPI003D7849BA
MNKAFDRVSWAFLFKVLKLFGFPKVFRKLIKSCVRTVSLQILINGTPSSRIFPQCGLRQGDPISPYLFILCMEILSLLIFKAEANGEIEGIKLSRQSPAISHLLYADDSLLCLRLTTSACESLRRILNDFSSISGQMINHQKSYIKFSPNTPADFKEHILDILHVQSKSNFGLYLGIPIDLGRRKLPSFQFLLDKISNKILSWGASKFFTSSQVNSY